MSVKITCIKKDNGNHENPYVAITSMNWLNEDNQKLGTSTREQMYDYVKDGHEAYVKDAAGNKAKLVAKTTDKGTKYVKTVADDVKSDNLLKLKECN
jgi:alanine dehydrogenase